jgi:hypothetical protein
LKSYLVIGFVAWFDGCGPYAFSDSGRSWLVLIRVLELVEPAVGRDAEVDEFGPGSYGQQVPYRGVLPTGKLLRTLLTTMLFDETLVWTYRVQLRIDGVVDVLK